jgi:hypothetical protein
MMKFFRKIRQNLLMENKTGKYFKYAIGEIALVMIGILLALQVNNWNEDRKNQFKETRYLNSLVRDLEAQIVQIDFKIEREALSKVQMEELLEEFRTNRSIKFSDENVVRFNGMLDRATYVVNKPTFTELLSTGNLEVISNEELRNRIVDYYQKMELSELILLKNNDLKDNSIQPSALKLVEFSPSAIITRRNLYGSVVSEPDEENAFTFPTMRKTAAKINEDEEKLFELINLLKMRWLISEASINFLINDSARTLSLIEYIKTNRYFE